jgi:3-oxoacyl-[acyl-carrier protein] reductase
MVKLSIFHHAWALSLGPAAYGATKAAIVQLTKNTAMEVGPFGINVNAIAPGLVVTDMVRGRMGDKLDEWIADRAQKAALGRVLKPEPCFILSL